MTDKLIYVQQKPTGVQKNNFSKCFRKAYDILTHFMPLISFYTPWKHQLSDVFRGYRKRPVAWNGLKKLQVQWDKTKYSLPLIKILKICYLVEVT